MEKMRMRVEQISCLLGLLLGIATRRLFKKRPLWLVGERGMDARDNGKWFFLWLKEHRKPVDAVYLITESSPDRQPLLEQCLAYDAHNVIVSPDGFRGHFFLGRCDLIVSTQWRCYHFVSPLFRGNTLGKWLLEKFKRKQVFLEHGVHKNLVKFFTYEIAPFDLYVCSALQEYEYVKENFGFPSDRIVYTGLCRFDKLHQFTTKRQILIMPTWRLWFGHKFMDDFVESEFYKTYRKLLESEELGRLLDSEDLTLVFYPHHELQRFISAFQSISVPANVIIAKEEDYDVQQLLKESALLVTDYSSVFFDFAYMLKPFIHFGFDQQRYDTEHYAPGYYDFKDGLGYYCADIPSLIGMIRQSVAMGFALEDKYRQRIEQFFTLNDTNNCQRVYDEIEKRFL